MDVNNTSNIPKPEFVNQDVLEFRLMYSTITGVLGLEPRETPIHTSGYSCSGATTIWNTLTGLGRGKSKCCNHEGKEEKVKTLNLKASSVYSSVVLCWRECSYLTETNDGILVVWEHNWVYYRKGFYGLKLTHKFNSCQKMHVKCVKSPIKLYILKNSQVTQTNPWFSLAFLLYFNFLLLIDFLPSKTYLNEHELVHGLVPLQQHHTGLQTTTQKYTTSLQVFRYRGRDGIAEQRDYLSEPLIQTQRLHWLVFTLNWG